MENCLPQLQAVRMRVTRLAADGAPLVGASSRYVSKALTRLALTPVYEDGTEFREKNAGDEVCVNYKAPDSLIRADVVIELCTPDPFLSEMLAGGDLLENGTDRGFAYPAVGTLDSGELAIELWTKRINNGVLDPTRPYAHWLLPKINNLRVGDKEFTNARQNSVFSGQGHENAEWGDGVGTGEWPVASDRVAQWIPTATLPVESCGYVAVAAA